MNRYDVASVAKFNPLSYQEIMAAPLAMRQKHDNSIATAEALRIQADPLNEHSARALEIKNQMDAEIAKNVDILNKEGYNPTTFQNITKLNRQYNDMISPTGEIGIINAAKIAEAKAKEDFMKNADKSFGQNVLEQKWLEHRQKYANVNGRDKDGKIINIDNLGSPKYVDLDTGIRDVLSTLGSTTKEKLLNSGLHFKNTDYGPVMVNAQGSVVTETNDRQLDNALNALKTRFINKTGEGRISRDFEGRTSDEDLDYINSRISAANVYKQNKDYKTNYDMISTGSVDVSNPSGTGVIINNDSTLKSDALNYTNYSDALNARKRLMKSNSPKDRAELADLEDLQRNADGKLNLNPKYKDLNSKLNFELNQWKNLSTKFNLSDDEKKAIKNDPSITPQLLFSKGFGSYKGNKNDPELKMIMSDSKLLEFNKLSKERQSYKDAAWKDSSSSRHSYSYLPTNSQEQTNWDIYNKGVFNTLKGGNLANLLDVSSIHTTNGSKTNVSNTDVNNIQALLNGADEKSFTINSIKTYGSNKTPEVTMTFIPNKNAKEYTMDRHLFTNYNDYGGAEKPVTVTFRLKDFSNASKTGSAVGYKSLSGAMTDFWKDKGGVNKITNNYQGAEVKDAFVKSEYSKYSNDELNKLRNVDEDANRALQIRYMEYEASKR